MKILIKNGHVVDPVNSIDEIKDIYIENKKISRYVPAPYDRIIDAGGKYIFPGFVDAHCHLRDPGFEYKEDILTGTRAAVKGGFTSVACMPNTEPVCDDPSIVEYIKSKAKKIGYCNVFPIGAVSKGQKGEELAQIGSMAKAGIVAVSDDGHPVEKTDLMIKAVKYSSDFGITVISHCEDMSVAKDGDMNEGYTSTILGLKGIPSIAEDVMVSRDIAVSRYTGIPIHIAHVSTRGSIDLIRQAKKQGVNVTCETCPHYFTLTEEACLGFNTMAKVNPPLRTQDDVQAIIEGIKDGTIDMIVTDHAPHHEDEKKCEFASASNGIAGFESAFSLAYTYLVKDETISLSRLITLMSVNPSDFLKIGRGSLSEGSPADIVIVDTKERYEFKAADMLSKSKNTPFDGWELFGRIKTTITGGSIVYEQLR